MSYASRAAQQAYQREWCRVRRLKRCAEDKCVRCRRRHQGKHIHCEDCLRKHRLENGGHRNRKSQERDAIDPAVEARKRVYLPPTGFIAYGFLNAIYRDGRPRS